MDDLVTERSFDSQATEVIDELGLFFDMLSISVCTTRHRQTSGRRLQELNICTVHDADYIHDEATEYVYGYHRC